MDITKVNAGALHEQQGIRVVLRIDLPDGGRITVRAETLYRRSEFGFAARFIEMSEDASARLDRALDQREPHDE